MTDITQAITALPTAPQRSDPDNFANDADTFLAALEGMPAQMNTFASQANTLAGEVNTNRQLTENAKDSALAALNAQVYPAGAPYSIGDACIASDGHTYRSIIDNNSADPVVDDTNYLKITTVLDEETGTGPDQIPRNSDLGTSSTKNTGTASGEVPLNSNTNMIKAWCFFDGTAGTVSPADSFGVNSIVDNGEGDYSVFFSTSFLTPNYAVLVTADSSSVGVFSGGSPETEGKADIHIRRASTSALMDNSKISLVAIGD